MSPSSSFGQDVKKEQILHSYLDGLYERLGMHFNRVSDTEMQNRGIDIVVVKNGRDFFVDEKAQLDYIGHSLPTFAFEIGYFKEAVHKKGWLFDEKKLTTHYMLITHIYLKEGRRFASTDDIASIKVLWLNRSKLTDTLERIGLGQTYCEMAEKEARTLGRTDRIYSGHPGYYFMLSDQKAEAPFNLVIGRSQLLTLGKQLHP